MIFEAIFNFLWKGGGVRKTLVLVRLKSFFWALEAEGGRSLRGMPEVSSFTVCLKACKAARACTLPRVPGGGGAEGWAQCALQCHLECGMLHVGSPPAVYQGSDLKNAPHLEVDSTPICSTIQLGSLHNQHLDTTPPLLASPSHPPSK